MTAPTPATLLLVFHSLRGPGTSEGTYRTATTQIIGRTSTAQHTKSAKEKREWNNELALEELRRSASRHSVSPEAVIAAEALLHWASGRGLEVSWGSGAKIGYGTFVVTGPDGVAGEPFGISTDSKLDLYPKLMRLLPPFDQDEVRLDFIRRIGAAVGVPVGDTVADQAFKSFPLDKLLGREPRGLGQGARLVC